MSDQDFGKLLLQARTEAKKTQGELAAQLTSVGLSVTQSTISAWEGGRQMPAVAALAEVAEKLGQVLNREAAAFLDAARLHKESAETPDRAADSRVPQKTKDLERTLDKDIEPADRIWAINPGSLAMTSNALIFGMWKARVSEGDNRETNVLWPLDVCDRYSIGTALRAFRKLGESAGANSNNGSVRHLAICRTARGLDLIAEYKTCAAELGQAYPFMQFLQPVALGVEAGRLVCNVDQVRLKHNGLADQLANLHDSMNALAPFIQWNTASLLYDGQDGLRHNLYKNASETRDGAYREDIGLWRPRQEAFELDEALRLLDSALNAILNTQQES